MNGSNFCAYEQWEMEQHVRYHNQATGGNGRNPPQQKRKSAIDNSHVIYKDIKSAIHHINPKEV